MKKFIRHAILRFLDIQLNELGGQIVGSQIAPRAVSERHRARVSVTALAGAYERFSTEEQP